VGMERRPDEPTRRSRGRGQRHGAEGSGGNESESKFAKHGLSPDVMRVRRFVSARLIVSVSVFSFGFAVSVLPIAHQSRAREFGFEKIAFRSGTIF
jgi:hypothetical protein